MSSHPTHEFALLLRRGDAAALDDAVTRSASTMETAGETDLLRYWQGRAQLLHGDADGASSTAARIAESRLAQELKILALRAQAKATKDSTALLAFLDERLATSGDATSLFESCEAHVRVGNVAIAAARAEELVRRVPTPAGLDVALQALMGAGDLAGVLRVSEDAGRLFPGGKLPLEYRRLRLQCEQQLGRVARILPEAERLASESGQPEDVAHLVQLQLKAADPKKAAVAARGLLRFGEVRAEDLIPTAHAVFPEDRHLSRKLLWRATEAKNLRAGILPAALDLAGKLGDDEIIGRLFPTLIEEARREGGPIRALDPTAAQSFHRAHQEHLAQAGQLYEQGAVPLHSITGTFGGSMPAFLDAAFHPHVVEAGKSPARPTVFIRHGARAAADEPTNFTRLHLDISAVLIAEELGLLDLLERVFAPLYLPPAVTEILFAELHRAEAQPGPRSAALREKMNGLLARIREGLQSERWVYLAEPSASASEEIGELESAGLLSLIQAPPSAGAVAWLDDRLLNGHGRCGTTLVVTVMGVLRELRRRGEMDSASMFAALHRLREAEVRYIPVEAEEILHWLSRAEIAQRQIVETAELATLRRYVALCLGDRGWLQGPSSSSQNPAGEAEVVLSLHRAITETLPEIWRQESSVEARVAQADWVLHELWFDPGSCAQILGVTLPATAALKQVGSAFSHLYFQGILLALPALAAEHGKPTGLETFMAWLFRRTANDSASLDHSARWLAEMFTPHRYEKGRNALEKRLLFEMLQGTYFALPEPLRERIKLSKRQRREMGIGRIDLLTFGSHSFEAQTYWRAAAAALAGQPTRVKAHGTEEEFELQSVEGDAFALRLVAASGDGSFFSADPVFLALRGNAAEREAGLLRLPEWFEAAKKPVVPTVRHLARIGNLTQRMDSIVAERKRSAAYCYREFGLWLERGHTPDLKDFEPPAMASLVRHLRLPWPTPSELTEADYEKAALTLLEEVGLEEALRRFAALPVRLPDALRNSVQALGVMERTALLDRLENESTTVTAQLHLVGLCFADEKPGRAAAIFRNLADDSNKEQISGFEAILRWVCYRFAESDEHESVPAAAPLVAAWVHATRLHHFLAPISREGQMTKFFDDATHFLPGEIFRTRDEMISDVAHPRALHRSRLLLLGLAHALPIGRELPGTLQEIVRGLALYREETARAPRIELIQPTHKRPNHLGSFLGADCGEACACLLAPEDAAFFASAEVDQAIKDALGGLREAPSAANHWITLATLLRQFPAPEGEPGDDFDKALLACQLGDFITAEPDATRVILFFQAGRASSEPIRSHVRKGLVELTKTLAAGADTQRSLHQRVELLLETAHQWATAVGNEKSAARDMSEIVMEMAAVWPAFAAGAWRILRSVVLRLPPPQIAELWPMIAKLRAESWRSHQGSDDVSE